VPAAALAGAGRQGGVAPGVTADVNIA
jgi:hypothetical protein